MVFDLVTFFLNLVTFSSSNRDDKFLCLVIIHKRYIDIFVKCTSDAATYTSVWQQVYGIIEKKHIARHGSSSLYVINSESIRQCTRTVNLNTIVENENANRGLHVQRTEYKAVYSELNQACVRYFQLTHAVEAWLDLEKPTKEELKIIGSIRRINSMKIINLREILWIRLFEVCFKCSFSPRHDSKKCRGEKGYIIFLISR